MKKMVAASALCVVLSVPGAICAQQQPQRARPAEGIVVHGSWTIDVRQPDGRLVSHREFENALWPSGAEMLQKLLMRQFSSGGFGIIFGSPTDSPCRSWTNSSTPVGCVVVPSDISILDVTTQPPIKTLTMKEGPDYSIVLGGTVTADAASTISRVSTMLFVCGAHVAPNACATAGPGNATFTGTDVSPGIGVQRGQIVQISVKISFSSPPPASTSVQ